MYFLQAFVNVFLTFFCIDVGFDEIGFLMQNPVFFCVFLMTRLCDIALKIVVGGIRNVLKMNEK